MPKAASDRPVEIEEEPAARSASRVAPGMVSHPGASSKGQMRGPHAYRVHFQISANVGFFPYIRMPTR